MISELRDGPSRQLDYYTFERVLRRHLTALSTDEPIDGSLALAALGLDSMGTISLMLELEESLLITFPEELLANSREIFATKTSLWAVVESLLGDPEGRPSNVPFQFGRQK